MPWIEHFRIIDHAVAVGMPKFIGVSAQKVAVFGGKNSGGVGLKQLKAQQNISHISWLRFDFFSKHR